MTKRKNQKSKKRKVKKSLNLKLISKFLLLSILTIIITVVSYFTLLKNYTQEDTNQTNSNISLEKEKEDLNTFFNDNMKATNLKPIIDKYEEYTKDLEKAYIDENELEKIKEELKEDKKNGLEIQTVEKKVFGKEFFQDKKEKKEQEKTEKEEAKTIEKAIDKNTNIVKKEITDKKIKKESNKNIKPKLAIVIDDVTLKSQVNTINSIGYTINIALMPPTKYHKDSAKIAQDLPFAIVHFPLQAGTTKFEEPYTLKVGDSYEKIEKRVAQIRKWYPKVKYTNNHTGSKFTAHEESMDKLLKALKKYDFQFVDSRTTPNTVVKKSIAKYDMPYIARNIFLDNNKDFKYIQNQLKKAIYIAKKTGSAIAIGHPYPITMSVLKKSKHLLKDIDLVYINKL